MIGKVIIGKSLRGCLLYCLNDKKQEAGKESILKDRAEVLVFNQCFGNQKELIQQFNEVRQLNPKLSKPALHITLSLAPGEQLTKDKLIDMCQECARDMGFENNQYIAVLHRDTHHQHLHLVANRVGFDKRTVSDSKNFQKIAGFCRKTELKYDLQQVLSPRPFLEKEQRLQPRQDRRKDQLKKDIQQILQQARNYFEFERKMQALGYQVLKGRGIAFIDDKKVKIKGSEVGFSLAKIEKIFALKGQLEIKQAVEKVRQAAQAERQEKIQKLLSPTQKMTAQLKPGKEPDQQPIIDLQKEIANLIEIALKPEYIPNQLAPELLREKRKKKRKPRHL